MTDSSPSSETSPTVSELSKASSSPSKKWCSTGIAVVAFLTSIASLSSPWWMPYTGLVLPSVQENKVSEKIEREVSSLRQKLDATSSKLNSIETLQQEVELLKVSLQKVTSHSLPIEGESGQILKNEKEDLERRLSGVETLVKELQHAQQQSQTSTAALKDEVVKLVASAAKLRHVLSSAQAFSQELSNFQAAAHSFPANQMWVALVESLEPLAVLGVPTRAGLLDSLPEVRQAILSNVKPWQESLGQWAFYQLKKYFWLRSQNSTSSASPGLEELIDQTEAYLTRGDLLAAVQTFAAIPLQNLPEVIKWLNHAQARLKVEELQGALELLPITLTTDLAKEKSL